MKTEHYYFDINGFHTNNYYSESKIVPIGSTLELDNLVKFFEQEIQTTNSVLKYNDGILDKQKIEQNLNELYSMRDAYNEEFFKDKSILVRLETDGHSPFGDNTCIVKSLSTATIKFHYAFDDIGLSNSGLELFVITVQKIDIKGVDNFVIANENENLNPNGIIQPYPDEDEYPQVKKPIIYLYPEKETNVSVKLLKPEKLTHTYPKYNGSWNVLAKPNGDLVDLSTGRSLYSLYWEGKNTKKSNMAEGFVIKGEDTIKFLEDKLAVLGLTEREANEFIIYWLPQLENNKYNYIRFQSIEEINNNMPLEIKPQPDSVIRIMMEFKPLNEYIEVKQQKLTTPERKGFAIVEWGGTQVK